MIVEILEHVIAYGTKHETRKIESFIQINRKIESQATRITRPVKRKNRKSTHHPHAK